MQVDWGYWCSQKFWRVEDAARLCNGIDPKQTEYKLIDDLGNIPREVSREYHRAMLAIMSKEMESIRDIGTATWYVRPLSYLDWRDWRRLSEAPEELRRYRGYDSMRVLDLADLSLGNLLIGRDQGAEEQTPEISGSSEMTVQELVLIEYDVRFLSSTGPERDLKMVQARDTMLARTIVGAIENGSIAASKSGDDYVLRVIDYAAWRAKESVSLGPLPEAWRKVLPTRHPCFEPFKKAAGAKEATTYYASARACIALLGALVLLRSDRDVYLTKSGRLNASSVARGLMSLTEHIVGGKAAEHLPFLGIYEAKPQLFESYSESYTRDLLTHCADPQGEAGSASVREHRSLMVVRTEYLLRSLLRCVVNPRDELRLNLEARSTTARRFLAENLQAVFNDEGNPKGPPVDVRYASRDELERIVQIWGILEVIAKSASRSP